MKLLGIKTDIGFWVSDNLKANEYHSSKIKNYRFDGQQPGETFHKDWFSLVSEPSKCERIVPEKTEIVSYELKNEFPPTDRAPQTVDKEFFVWDSETDTVANSDIKGLYKAVQKTTPEQYTKEPLEIEVIATVDNVSLLSGLNYDVRHGQWPNSQPGYIITKAKHEIVDKIFFPKVLLPTRPCKLSSYQSFQIIRNHIKDNIDPKYAEITSDYDFCLSVAKKIRVTDRESYQVDTNNSIFSNRKRKPKYETRYRTDRKIVVYETAPQKENGVYKGYTKTEGFEAGNYRELEEKIEKFLNNLMEAINKPFIDCPNCKGQGVIVDTNG